MTYTVDAVDKALDLLFLVADQPGLGVTELARRSGMTKARSYRLLDTLEKCGLVRRHEGAPIYRLGYMAMFLGARAREQLRLVRLATQYLEDIVGQLNEQVYVRVRDGLDSVCIAHRDAWHEIRVHTQVGSRKPLYAGASGKLLAAHAEEDVQLAVLAAKRQSFTPATVTTRGMLEKEFQQIRRQGYSISRGERVSGMVAMAVPVRDVSGCVIAALSVALPQLRDSDDRLNGFFEVLTKSAARLSRELGYECRVEEGG